MKLQTMLAFLMTTFLFMGCAAQTSNYLEDKPLLIFQVDVKQSPQLQDKAAKAFLSALNRYKWEVREFNKAESIIVAEACRHGGNNCAEIMATIMPDGSVSILRTPGQVLTIDEGAVLKKWVGSLQRQYQKNMRNVW